MLSGLSRTSAPGDSKTRTLAVPAALQPVEDGGAPVVALPEDGLEAVVQVHPVVGVRIGLLDVHPLHLEAVAHLGPQAAQRGGGAGGDEAQDDGQRPQQRPNSDRTAA